MRDLFFRLLFLLTRSLRPRSKRHLRSLANGDTVLYLQFEKALGCCVHGTPVVEALRAIAPDVHIVVAARGTGAATLLHHPGVEQLFETRVDPLSSLSAMWRTAAELRRRLAEQQIEPVLVVQDASSRRGRWALFAALLRLAPTLGFADAPQLYDCHLPCSTELSLIENNLRLAAVAGGSADHREPAVFFAAGEHERARALLDAIPADRLGLIGFVLQGSGGQQTGWHDQRFAAVIQELESRGYATVFFGTEPDAAGIQRICRLAGSRGISLAGKTSIPEAAALLCLCDLLISVDTGTMHLGRSAGVPMIVLGPSWQRPLEWLPLGLDNVRILRGPDREDVPPGYRLDEISVADVLAAATETLRQFPPSAERRGERVRRRLAEVRP